MKRIKIFLVLTLLLSLLGCNETKQPFDFIMFYANWCPTCEGAKEKFIPKLEEEFKGQINIIYYDIDTSEGMKAYKEYVGYIDQDGNEVDGYLKDVDREFKELEQFPLFILKDHYGFFNWASIYNLDYIEDIKNVLAGKEYRESIYDVVYAYENK